MQLNIRQRFAVVGIYIFLILLIGFKLTNAWTFIVDTNNNLNAVLIATGLALILSTYITEPFFSKPVDVITRWVAIFLFLVGLNNREDLLLYNAWLFASAVFTLSALILIFIHGSIKYEKPQRIAVDIICKISRPEIVFTALYFDIVYSFFRDDSVKFPVLMLFGALIAINGPIVWLVNFISIQFKNIVAKTDSANFLGQIIGHESTDLYKVELASDNLNRQKQLVGCLVYLENITNGVAGIILSEQILLGKKWIEVLSLRDKKQDLISFNIKSLLPLTGEKSIFSKTNAVYLLDTTSLDDKIKPIIESNPMNEGFERFIGNVWEGSTIDKIRFNKLFSDDLLKKRGIGEGTIIQTVIADEEVLYQIIDARTDEENLEYKDTHGFTIGTAQKLGRYDTAENELNTVKWLPEIYTPIFLLDPVNIVYDGNQFIGKLPNTNYGIGVKNPKELVTHNTAILGILGIGKSCLTFELLKKTVVATNTKVICVDITGQYLVEVSKYINTGVAEIGYAAIEQQISPRYKAINKDIEEGGNYKAFKEQLTTRVTQLLDTATERVLIFNPQQFNVSYQVGELKNKKIGPGQNDWQEVASMRDLTVPEITRLISEVSLELCKAKGMTNDARLLLVFEEAHSLVPEWNSVANDGDKSATNGTAKVILQGRKYGLGTFVVTQRTANISKSILNQCNTIFAMRVFDDTGKQFLENYIGSDYSNLLPTLEERHCIAIGKALKLKQPVILELNDMNDIILPPVVIP
ncbi:helicase HerA domain-containing protein [Agriterribacter humi]|uniref:helicase HerA domain-containing protein n=1 Tax=Agriterribacter humi TaxID=1104781 RepID=UPI00126523AF|nr:DUF87 domain-containing protein [Agriterribacter humi]